GASGRRWVWLAVAVVAIVAAFLYVHFELGTKLSLENLKQSRDALRALVDRRPVATVGGFFALYVVMTGLSVPGAAILSLAAGALFGLWTGALVVSFGASIGATLAFLTSRYLLRDAIRSRFGRRLDAIDAGVSKDGAFYLLTLRLIPAFPFFVVNLLMGLTAIPVARFYWVSQLGMLPATVIYVNAGTRLAEIGKLSDVLSPALLGSFVLLGLFPLIARWAVRAWQARRVYRDWPRPARFDRNLIVIGAGSGGLVSAYIAAAVRAEVTLVESGAMGGDCLNTGCVPSKTLIRSARLARDLRHANAFGLRDVTGASARAVDFAAVMRRVRAAIDTIAPHDSVERYRGLGVDVVQGYGRLVSPWAVEVDAAGVKRTLTARSSVIATGSSPRVPSLPGLDATGYVTSETVWDLTELPQRLVVLGGGPIGCELAQAFAQLGSQVTQIEQGGVLLSREDPEVSACIAEALRADGVDLLLAVEALRCEATDGSKRIVVADAQGTERAIAFDVLLVAVGRAPRTAGFGLEGLGIRLSPQKTIEHDAFLQTNFPNIYAVGDVAGPWQFTHTASHQAWYAAINALFGRFKRFAVDTSVIPWATFTLPEVARVGLSETEARDRQIDHEVTRFPFAESDRAIADGATHGSIKVLTAQGEDRILGVTIVGEHASEMLAEYVLAMKHGLGLNKVLGTIHVYPTFAEINKSVAGVWRRAHQPERLLAIASRYHRWMRS
ncbi:MAG: FAD-dependent oxidoreductase, partial [Burkholderiaceae bacterium]